MKYLAVVSTRAELLAVEKFAAEMPKGSGKIVLICHAYAQGESIEAGNVIPKTSNDYLNKKELVEIERERFRLVLNWFKFDRQFEESLLFNGI
ncbi:MAG: hypothetical protein Q8N60_05465, partial [Candidatus Diapherotrites archaeon]|nr:hypothetical protein [Candidatus Diapherotrites archaeon]